MSMLDVFARAMTPIAGRTGLAFVEGTSRMLVTDLGARLAVVVEIARDRSCRPVVAFAETKFVESMGPTDDLPGLESTCRKLLGSPPDLVWHASEVAAAGTAVCVLVNAAASPAVQETLQKTIGFLAARADAELVRMRSERRALLESRLGLLRDASDELVWHWHIATGRVEWSDATLAEGAMSFEDWRARIHRGDRERIAAAFEQLREGLRDRWEDHCRYTRGDGRTRIARIQSVLERRQDGKPIRVIGTFADITEMKDHEQRLIVAERMAAMGTLASGVAHEINNPLAYVKGNVEHVLEQLRGVAGIHPDLVAALDEAREGAERVQRIVQDLRLFSRPQDEGNAPVDVDRVVEAALSVIASDIERRARLEKVLRHPPLVDANEARLAHVVLALVVNALQALPADAPEAHVVGVETGADETGHVFVLVRDTGAGIPSEILGRIFDPFFTTKRVGDGTGLGLSIARSIVASLGGDISVDSAPGVGTSFRVTLPIRR